MDSAIQHCAGRCGAMIYDQQSTAAATIINGRRYCMICASAILNPGGRTDIAPNLGVELKEA